jgi:hypothetical protein
MTQTKHELLFAIHYAIRLEKMTANLMGRLDRVSSFVQLLLGAAVFADSPYQKLIGIILVLTSMFAFVWQPAGKAAQARSQKQEYERLLVAASSMAEDALATSIQEVRAKNSDEIGALCTAAHIGVEISMGLVQSVRLSPREKIVAWLAGDLPRSPAGHGSSGE